MTASKRPNILFLFTDQQRADTIAAHGNPIIRTPQMDRLAGEGTSFLSAFTPSPVCCSARCSTHYGLYPTRTGLYENGPMCPEDEFVSYPAFLGRHGYRTHSVGKCHFTPDSRALRGFQTRRLQEECRSDPDQDDYVAWLAEQGLEHYEPMGARGQMYYVPQISSQSEAHHPTTWVAEESIGFMRSASAEGKPWCLFSSFIHPHPPFAPPKPWHKLYHVRDFPLPQEFSEGSDRGPFCWVNRLQNRYKYRDGGFDYQIYRLIRAYYYACVSFIDFQIGRMLDFLEQEGQLDHTLIVLSSDHGELLGDFGCFGKRSMHDAAARVPMIIRYPERFAAGATCRAASSLIDLFPTFAGAAGLSDEVAELDLDGIDLAGLAANPDPGRVVFSQLQKGERGLYLAANADAKFVHSTADRSSWAYDRTVSTPDQGSRWNDANPHPADASLRDQLLNYLERVGHEEGFERKADGTLDFRKYPAIDESYLDDPNARLLSQDNPWQPRALPGYTDRLI